MSNSDSSSLSSPPSTDDETVAASINRSFGLEKYFKPKKPASPPPPKRAPSPPHEYVLADNPDIAVSDLDPFIVMFRARFSEVFPKSLPHYGPQDIERGVTDAVPGDHIERLLCALIGLILNRKKDVERGHYQRALEEVIQTHSSQWPKSWNGKNPLHGGGSFASMSPTERLSFLKTLILWCLSASDAVQAKLKESYKQARHDDDLNQPLSVQPWGNDAYKRRYWLIEGQDDTHFRLYRESNPALKNRTWWSVAGTIPELKTVADSLAEEKSQHSRRLSERIYASIPRFEGSEEKRKRRDYRLARKAAFARPEPGFSLYEGRTRGKKLKYTYSEDEEDFSSDALPTTRKSTRNSRLPTPGEPAGPTFTASGRQVRARVGGSYGESMLSGQRKEMSESVRPSPDDGGEQPVFNGRPRRDRKQTNGTAADIDGYNAVDEMDEESDAASSENDWDGGDEDNDFNGDDDDEEMSDGGSITPGDGEEDGVGQQSLVVQLRYGKGKQPLSSSPVRDLKSTPVLPSPAASSEAVQQTVAAQPLSNQQSSATQAIPTAASEKHAPAPTPVSAVPAPAPTPTLTPSLPESKDTPQAQAQGQTTPQPSAAAPPVVPMETDPPTPQPPAPSQNGVV
ncbi:hypothetical protein FQN52_004582 [Onygenales sp. PD_12]|nr:hypothetical protein FQN52_004582 [Onygenales sp. PD_12]